jgi:subtilisin-like proprotein convertase family protein
LLKLCLTGTALAWGLAASAQTFTTSTNFAVGANIPDGDTSGLASAQIISTPVTNVTGLKVTLKLSGTWSGDLYCFLSHGTGQSVLLNRVGRGSASDLGYNDQGLDVTFDDSATNADVHVYRLQVSSSQDTPLPGPLTGVWAPDARVAYPTNVLDTDARSAFLSSFNGVDPNGEWVLFVADLETGDIHKLESWGLEITGVTAPTGPE